MLAAGGPGVKPQNATIKRNWHYMPSRSFQAVSFPTRGRFWPFSGLKWPLRADFGPTSEPFRAFLHSRCPNDPQKVAN